MSAEWMLDSLRGFLHSPIWTLTINSFIDHKCVVFDPGEENKFSYTEIHNEYRRLVEDMLEGFSSDFHISPEQFVAMCADGLASGSFNENMFEHIFAADDFLMFKSMMVQRNIQLDLQAIELIKSGARQGSSLNRSLPPSYESVIPESDRQSQSPLAPVEQESQSQPQPGKEPFVEEKKEDPQEAPSKEDEEERILREVIEQSKLDYQAPAFSSLEIEEFLDAAKDESQHLYELKQLEEEQMARHLQMALILSEEEAQKSKEEEKKNTSSGQKSAQDIPTDAPVVKQVAVDATQKSPPNDGGSKPLVSALPPIVSAAKVPNPSTASVPQPLTDQPQQPTSIWEACLEAGSKDKGKVLSESLLATQRGTPPTTSGTSKSLETMGTTAATSEGRGEPLDSDPERRAAYWKAQRDKLLALKQEEREKHVERALASQKDQRPVTAAMARRVVANPTGSPTTAEGSTSTGPPSPPPGTQTPQNEERRRTMLNALTQRLKKDLVENMSSSS